MSRTATDRNLLFGILALQMEFIAKDALITAMNAWVLGKDEPLGRILLKQKALTEDEHALLEALVQKHLQRHDGDAEKSLAAVSSAASIREALGRIADPDVQASLTHVSAPSATNADPFATRPPSTVPAASAGRRFRVLRPHAKGGLGEVFVAADEELHREVALKEIQGQHADEPDSRARFLLEAEVTGQLEHPGIVPVYGLGIYDDGRPFYAMRFIRGDSLRDAIEKFHEADKAGRDPGERALALRGLLGRFVDVCNAIAYAHSRGVLHRDLKPGNVMLGQYGETLVVDWGLAKPTGHAEAGGKAAPVTLVLASTASGSAPTVMGSAVGTPAYMSPEQAAGRLDRLGPASDVYSLGATLYCLLTGRPPFRNADVGALLQQVQRGDFPPPRQVKADVAPALEAVCLKAMALRPEDRYPTARALADDIEHWLADEPVSAYREPWRARLRRWARRHRAAVTGLAALLLTAVVALAVSTVLIGREQARTEAARALAQQNYQLAAQQRQRAEVNFTRARDAVDQMLTRVGQGPLAQVPHMQGVRRNLLEQALNFYKGFLAEKSSDPTVRRETARAYSRVAGIQYYLGRYADAEKAYGQAVNLFEQLIADEPAAPAPQAGGGAPVDARQLLARTERMFGRLLEDAGRFADAEHALRRAVALLEPLGRGPAATPAARQDLALVYNDLGILMRRTRRPSEAEHAYRESMALNQRLVADSPAVPAHRLHLAYDHADLANLLGDLGRPTEGLREYREALALYEGLARSFANSPEYRQNYARASDGQAYLLAATGRNKEAEQADRRVIELDQALVRDYPGVPGYRYDLAGAHRRLASLLWTVGRIRDAEHEYRQMLPLQERLVRDYPAFPTYREGLAAAHNGVGGSLQRLGRLQQAEQEFIRARTLYEALAKDFPATADYRSGLGQTDHNLGVLFIAMRRYPEAEQTFRKALAAREQLAEQFPATPGYRQNVIWSRQMLGVALEKEGRPAEAAATLRQALAERERLAADHPDVVAYRTALAAVRAQLAWLLATTTDPALRDLPLAIELARQATEAVATNASYWTTLGLAEYRAGNFQAALAPLEKVGTLTHGGTGSDRFFLAMAQWRLGHTEEALRGYDGAAAWTDAHGRGNAMLQAFRREATAVLGIDTTVERLPAPRPLRTANGPAPVAKAPTAS